MLRHALHAIRRPALLRTALLASMLTLAAAADAQPTYGSRAQFMAAYGTVAENDLNALANGSTRIAFGALGTGTVSGSTVVGGAITNPGPPFSITFSQLIDGFGADFLQPAGTQTSVALSVFNGTTRLGVVEFGAGGAAFFGTSSSLPGVPPNSPFDRVEFSNATTFTGGFLRVDNVIVGVVATSTVPEPATVALFGTGLLVVGGLSRRRPRTTG